MELERVTALKWVKRIALVLLTIILSSTITFVIIRMMPGDPVTTLAMEIQRTQGASFEDAVLRAKNMLNFDPDIPIYTQYFNYISGIFQGNFGLSMAFKTDVMTIVGQSLAWTLFVSVIALAISFIIGTVLGMYIAWKRGRSILDPLMTIWDAVLGSIPAFVIAYVLVLLLSVQLGWFPSRGNYGSNVTPGWNLPFIGSMFYHAALPVLAWVITGIGGWALSMKAMASSALGEDYITSARARGLGDRRIIFTYVGRNAMLPQVTALAISFAGLFAGSTMVENVFVYPGIGFYFGRAITSRDYPLMQGIFLVITVAVVITNQLAEVIYSFIDPRIREGR